MNDDDLVRKLNSVGKAAFVENYSLFKSYADGTVSRQKCIDTLVENGTSNEAGAAIRIGNASLIFRYQKEREALAIIVASTRIPSNVVRAARNLLTGHN